MLPPVIRHLTSRPTLPFPSVSSKIFHLSPKPPASNGKSPGRYCNLFTTFRKDINVDEPDLSETRIGRGALVPPKGVNFRCIIIVSGLCAIYSYWTPYEAYNRVIDVAPRTKGSMHKTSSIDFLIVYKGRITLHLEDNEKVTANEGDVIVQRGTTHAWENETDEWVRMYVVLVSAEERGKMEADDTSARSRLIS